MPSGLALVIAVKQWPHLVGVAPTAATSSRCLRSLCGARAWQLPSLACGVAALAGLFALERVPRIPGALVVIIASIAAAAAAGRARGRAHRAHPPGADGAAVHAPAGVHWLPLTEFSLALMFILYAESYGSIRTYALKHDETVQSNRDLIALGVANMVSGLFQGTPVGAGYSGTSANDAAGARSRFAGLSAAAVVLVLVLSFLSWIERIPQPALAAIVIHAVSKSLRLERLQSLSALAAGPAHRLRRSARGAGVRRAERPAGRDRLQPRHAAALTRASRAWRCSAASGSTTTSAWRAFPMR